MISIPILSLIIALVFGLIWQFVINQKTESELVRTRDKLLSIITGKKMIVRRRFLRKEELEYLEKIKEILQGKYLVQPQVHLSDISDVQFGYYDHDNLFYELKRIIIDYVIFDQNYNPLVGIELNGKSHLFKSRISRDAFTENILRNIGMEYLEINLQKKPSKKEVFEKLEFKINLVKEKLVFPTPYVECKDETKK